MKAWKEIAIYIFVVLGVIALAIWLQSIWPPLPPMQPRAPSDPWIPPTLIDP